jgi:hypothetical protein
MFYTCQCCGIRKVELSFPWGMVAMLHLCKQCFTDLKTSPEYLSVLAEESKDAKSEMRWSLELKERDRDVQWLEQQFGAPSARKDR